MPIAEFVAHNIRCGTLLGTTFLARVVSLKTFPGTAVSPDILQRSRRLARAEAR
jgi:hypothetical protein